MAKKRKEDGAASPKMSMAEAFQSKMNEVCKIDVPEPILCSTGNSLLDTIIGGGLATGKYHVFAAPAHSGKSTTCIRTIASFLHNNKDGLALWVDGEQATPPNRLIQLGIPYYYERDENNQPIMDEMTGMPKPQYHPNGEVKWDNRFFRIPNNITLEKAFQLIDSCINTKIEYGSEDTPLLVVFDSLDSLPCQKESEIDNVDSAIGAKPKVLGFLMKKYLFKLAQYNICCIFICHIGQKLSMNGPYEAYDGKMASMKNFTISGGKPIQFYPSNMIFFRQRMGTTIDKDLEDMGISSGFIVEATTLKAKNFSFNLTVPIVFDTLRGFDEYATRFVNMKKNDWFGGAGVSRFLPEYPDDKFNAKTFFNKLNTEQGFREKVDVSWKNYLKHSYGKYHAIMNAMTGVNQTIDNIDSISEDHLDNIITDIMEDDNNGANIASNGGLESNTKNTISFGDDSEFDGA